MSIKQVIDYKRQLTSLYWEMNPLINRFYQLRKKIERDVKLTDGEKKDIVKFINREMKKLMDDGNGKSFMIPLPSPSR